MSSGFAFAFLVLISASMCLVAQTQPQENIWQSVEEAIDNFANFQTGAILVGSDDLGVVFNYTKGMQTSWRGSRYSRNNPGTDVFPKGVTLEGPI
jgi:hypothetical protein